MRIKIVTSSLVLCFMCSLQADIPREEAQQPDMCTRLRAGVELLVDLQYLLDLIIAVAPEINLKKIAADKIYNDIAKLFEQEPEEIDCELLERHMLAINRALALKSVLIKIITAHQPHKTRVVS